MKIMRRAAMALMAVCAVAWAAAGSPNVYRVRAVLRHGWVWWQPVTLDSKRLSPAMRLALHGSAAAKPGAVVWVSRAPGFETAELPALVDGQEVDRIMLARIDPQKYTFEVRTSPGGDKTLATWMAQTKAALIVNGSYFGHDGSPATPLRSFGKLQGPARYDGHAGAFVSSDAATSIHDLRHEPWTAALAQARDGLVSFPMLIAPGGRDGVARASRWLANRSFVGEDSNNRVLVGTTRDAFFTLDALSRFLLAAPLDLTAALNLDGGPVACQGIALGTFRRHVYGKWEFQANETGGHLLTWLYGDRFAMPVVLAVFPK
jgi:hypothetical protein